MNAETKIPSPSETGTDPLANPTIAETKRFLELYTGIQSFQDAVNKNLELTEAPFGFRFRPSAVRPIIDAPFQLDLRARKIPPSPPVAAYRQFIREKIAWRGRIRSECRPSDERFAAWRDRQIARSKVEFGAERDDYFIHAPVMFELAKGCSVGCWFCAFSAPKLSELFTYTPENSKFYKEVLQVCQEVIGPGTRWAANYFATDPLDNPDHEHFSEDFADVLGIWPQTTTAIPHRDVERTRALIKRSRERGCRVNRFSLISTSILQKVHEAFTAEELRDVELIVQSQEGTMPKARAGRYIDTARKSAKIEQREDEKMLNSLKEKYSAEEAVRIQKEVPDQPGSICCVTGFLINMVEKSIKLISPVGANERWPLGMIIFDERHFTDAADLRRTLQAMIADMPQDLPRDGKVRLNDQLRLDLTNRGFELSSAATRLKCEREQDAKLMRYLGELLSAGDKSVNEICLLCFYKCGVPPQKTMGIIQQFFKLGLLHDEPEAEPRLYYKTSGPQMIGKPTGAPKTATQLIAKVDLKL